MPFNSKGEWVPEDDSVSTKLNTLTASDSPYILQARQAGLASANSRGLLNSSIAAGASQGAAISAALPIASQDAAQTATKNNAYQSNTYQTGQIDQQAGIAAKAAETQQGYNMQTLGATTQADKDKITLQGNLDMDRQKLVTSAGDRTAALGAALQAQQTYATAFTDIAQNKDIPAATRDAYIQNLINTRNTGLDMIQQIYGINLDWGQSTTPTTGSYGVVPTDKKTGVQSGGGGYNSYVPGNPLLNSKYGYA